MQADDDRIASMADALDAALTALLAQRTETAELKARVEILETRQYLRDKSHDEPVSNAGEAVGMNLPLSDAAQIDRFFDFIRNEQLTRHWWQFWRRA